MSWSFEYSDGTVAQVSEIADALLPLFDAIADPDATWEPWFVGEAVDHLYASCPAVRGQVGRGAINPEDEDVCGWCQRGWPARCRTTLAE